MIKATVLIDNLAWKKKIKNPQRFINTEIKKMQNHWAIILTLSYLDT